MKFLGQHFLKNKSILKKIADAVDIRSGDVVIEVGAGHGELTKEFRMKNLEFSVIAVEKDKKLAENLKKEFARDENIKIIEADILKILPQISKFYIPDSKFYKLVGNIPYYITGYLLRIIGELERKPSLAIFLIQKEVAERICAIRQARGKQNMNLLAASVQFWAEPKILFNVSKNEFSPPPEVESAVLELKTRKVAKNEDKNAYYKTVKVIFKQPRKTILNNLVSFGIDKNVAKSAILKIGLKENSRPQDLSIFDIIKLSKLIELAQ